MSVDQIAAEALRLPVRERVQLASSLWESLGGPDVVEDAEAVRVAAERDREIETGVVRPLNHDELMARLRR